MNQLIKTERQLPATIEELHQFILIGKERLNAHRAKIRAIDKLQIAHVAKEAALNDAQDLADILLDAESKMGEMIENEPNLKGRDLPGKASYGVSLKNYGINQKESHFAQTVARNPEWVIEIKKKAREEGRLATSQDVIREVQKQKQNENISVTLAIFPSNKYQTIVIDPPWPVQKILRDVRPNQDVFDYRPLPLDEIKALPISQLAFENCHLYLWTTHKHLPAALEILECWGFSYQCLLTWVKNVGMTPFSWMYSTEHVLFGRKGSLDLLKKGVRLDFAAKVREHSRKPDEFYSIIREVSPEPRIDVFSREKRDGFDQYGNETEKFPSR